MQRIEFKNIISGIFNSYSQIFFSDKKAFAFILLVVSFFDWFAGLCGIASVVLSIGLAYWLGYDKYKITSGYYSFNSLLVGLGIGIFYAPSYPLLLVIIAAAILTFFISVLLEAVIGKYYLPYLSIPFLLSLWMITLSMRDFQALELSSRGLYKLNELYDIGGQSLVELYTWWTNLGLYLPLKVYFISLGAIFFQYNLLAGILIAIGLLYFSRIAFTLSLFGFFTAYLVYGFTGAEITDLSYNHIGFNFILTSIAVGGVFIIPSRMSYLWTILLVPLVIVISISFSKILEVWQLSIFSLPFNFVVLLFVYTIKMRLYKSALLAEPYIMQSTPEANLYTFHNANQRFDKAWHFPIKLPFWGVWSVTQGHDGKHTHKEEWKYAWDFEILDDENRPFRGMGTKAEDYHCYGKMILAPAPGTVVQIEDKIPDNNIGDINTTENWGNTIIIKHSEFLYSKLCHLQPDSFKVYIGENVKQGQQLASCGNSGRSPQPHLHFQLQATPFIGSKTIKYPVSSYIRHFKETFSLESFTFPKQFERVSNIEKNTLLYKTFHFIPGQKLKFEVKENENTREIEWEVFTDIHNNSYIYCKDTESFAYFFFDGYVFYFKNFVGDKSSLLYYFFLGFYKIQTGFYKGLKLTDAFPLHHLFKKSSLFFQDFIAPFYIFYKAKYDVIYESADNDLSPSLIKISSVVEKSIFNKVVGKISYEVEITEKGFSKIIITDKEKLIQLKCLELSQ
ncbi:MAG: hypothetical protein A2275_19200 [Bacteroidetes bacterium RIFOXYA12_FULL_35_11]|nr:MAG: hypothetical protein A2X01_10100 [Bacteroidetes bacterium GWF2_35_48]OFY72758.1 MAG: hypothetical protein A2275_19200 [Bacteroidetes bacterium RIFOXYA12_FULL_35_11]OFY97224.1 MAG: hypothetical protein A2309_11965 [Bacteroidetes bacterium RIFOXYB2_FULL_35_7]HBX50001.1 peptidase M23 [Bacteroidales bacterium]